MEVVCRVRGAVDEILQVWYSLPIAIRWAIFFKLLIR